jgi:hypothetical protein
MCRAANINDFQSSKRIEGSETKGKNTMDVTGIIARIPASGKPP